MIRILVDSSADYTLEELKERELELAPLVINIGEDSYRDVVEITRDELYQILLNGTEHPKTSQPSPQDFVSIFEKVKEAGDSMICILLSSTLSGTFQSATIAKDMVEYEHIHIIDSLSATHAIRLLADHACQLRKEELDVIAIIDAIEDLKSRTKILAAVDTLEYLYKGGRVSKAVATVGELASIKPIITITDQGTVAMTGKALGRNKAIQTLTKMITECGIDDSFPCYSVYAFGTENAELLEQKLTTAGIRIDARLQIGAAIGVHVGPGAYGAIFVQK